MRFFSFLGSSFRVAPSTPWVVELELYGIIWHYGGQGVGTCLGFFRVALSNRLAVFVFSFPVSTFSTKRSFKYSCVLAMNCYDLLNLFWASRFTTRPIPAALTPRREARRPDVCRRIRWSLDRFGLTAASLVAEKLIRRLSLDSDSWNRRWSGEAKAQGLTESLSQVSESSPWNSQLTQGLKRVR